MSIGQTKPLQASSSVTDYARGLQEMARRLEATTTQDWGQVVDRGLKSAYQDRDPVGLASMVQVIVGFLDAEGRFDSAVAEVDHALAIAAGDVEAVAILHAMRACFLSVLGRDDLAQTSLDIATRIVAAQPPSAAVLKARTMSTAAQLLLLRPTQTREVELLLPMTDPSSEADRLFLLSTYVPFRFALGHGAQVHPWIRSFRLAAESSNHRFRIGDAISFEEAERTLQEPLRQPSSDKIPKWNALARWRVHAMGLRACLLSREFSCGAKELTHLSSLRARAGTTWPGIPDPFEAVLAAHEGIGASGSAPSPPQLVRLTSIGANLAAAEGVATTGSQFEASAWSEWVRGGLPGFVETSLEWPVSRRRIQGLLSLRSGDVRRARRDLSEAIEWGIEAGYPMEEALAQLQLAELLRRHGSPAQERLATTLKGQAWTKLRNTGIDPTHHAYTVAGAFAPNRNREFMPHLTPREMEVLALLAQGLTYKAVAESLKIKWPTVQALAHRCYEKLEVSGRVKAITAARELGIL